MKFCLIVLALVLSVFTGKFFAAPTDLKVASESETKDFKLDYNDIFIHDDMSFEYDDIVVGEDELWHNIDWLTDENPAAKLTESESAMSSESDENIYSAEAFGLMRNLYENFKGFSGFLENFKRFDELRTQNEKCEANNDPNLDCGASEEIEDLRKELVTAFNNYKSQLEPMIDDFYLSAETSLKNNGEDPKVFKTIHDVTQQMKESLNSLLFFVTSK